MGWGPANVGGKKLKSISGGIFAALEKKTGLAAIIKHELVEYKLFFEIILLIRNKLSFYAGK